MSATGEIKLFGSGEISVDSGAITNNPAVAAFAAAVGIKNYVQKCIISASGTIAAAVSFTLTYTFGGVAQTIGIQIPVTFVSAFGGVLILDFGANTIESDDNTAITATLPALGASGVGRVDLIGYKRQI